MTAEFRAYLERRNAERREAEERANRPPDVVKVLESERVDLALLPPKAKALAARLVKHGWAAIGRRSLVWYPSERYIASSEATGAEAGDIRKAEREVTHWFLSAAVPAGGIGFRASWEEKVTPKGGRGFAFDGALVHDPVGMPTEMWANYEPTSASLRRVKDEPEHAHRRRLDDARAAALRRDASYNDGASYLNRSPAFEAWGEFDSWITEWLEITTKREGEAA